MKETQIENPFPAFRIHDNGKVELELHRDDHTISIVFDNDTETLHMLDNLVPKMIAARQMYNDLGYEDTCIAFGAGPDADEFGVGDFIG